MDAALGATRHALGRLRADDGGDGRARAATTRSRRSRPALETTLMSATASPQSMTKLTDAVDGGAGRWRRRSTGSPDENVAAAHRGRRRDRAGRSARSTTRCTAVDDINRKIATLAPKGVDVTGLQDERSRMIDGIAAIVPVKVGEARRRPGGALLRERRGAARRQGVRARLHAGGRTSSRRT